MITKLWCSEGRQNQSKGHCFNMKPKQLELWGKDDVCDQLKLQEMQGYHSLKLKKEALELARYFLEQKELGGEIFCKSVDVIDGLARKSKNWVDLIETAYQHVKRIDREMARKGLLLFFSKRRAKEKTLKYLPRKVTHKTDLVELLFVWEIWLDMDRMDLLEKAAPIMSKAIQSAEYSRMSAFLSSAYAKYWLMRAKLLEDEEMEKLQQNYLDKLKGKSGDGTQ